MRKLVYSALALTLVSVPGFASENEWSSLDQEINNLSSSLSAQNAPGPRIGGYIKTSFRYSDDEDALFGAGNDEKEAGFKLDNVRIEITGDLGQDYTYKVSFDLASGTASLRDAFLCWKIGENVKGTWGNFKKPFLRSALIGDKNLLFYQRTALGDFFSVRETGLMFSGTFDTVEWYIHASNGTFGDPITDTNSKIGDDFNFAARLVANLMGAGVGKVEGAYGAGDETNLTVGLAWQDDTNIDDGTAIALDAALTAGPFSLAAEIVDFDDGDSAGDFPNKAGGPLHYGSDNTLADMDPAGATPWDITASYMFTDQYEAGLRYQDADDDDDTNAISACVNRYVQGHDIKWTLEYLHTSSDVDTAELDEWTLGLTGGF